MDSLGQLDAHVLEELVRGETLGLQEPGTDVFVEADLAPIHAEGLQGSMVEDVLEALVNAKELTQV